jgi:hypothetical protein
MTRLRALIGKTKGLSAPGVAALVAALAVGLDAYVKKLETGATRKTASQEPVPAEQRHHGLDRVIAAGIRLPGRGGIEQVEVGSFEISKKKIGHIRLGAYNEAVIRRLTLTVNRSFFAESALTGLRIFLPGEAGLHKVAPKWRLDRFASGAISNYFFSAAGPLSGSLWDLWAYSPHSGQSISGMSIRNFRLVLRSGGSPDLVLVRAGRVAPGTGRGHSRLVLSGNVRFEDIAGRRLLCEEAILLLEDKLRVTATRGLRVSAEGTQTVGRITFPLRALVDGVPQILGE